MMVCKFCGRKGTRGFIEVDRGHDIEHTCSNTQACERRQRVYMGRFLVKGHWRNGRWVAPYVRRA
jgi:hypothetical protein